MRRRNRAISYFGIACGNCNCYLLTVQRLFSFCPPGMASLPLSFWVQSSRSQLSSILASVRSRFAPPQLTHSRCWWGCFFPGISCPYCAALSCLIELILLVTTAVPSGFQLAMSALTAAAAAVLGPGAYSLDARLFGRKLIKIPPGRNL